MDLDYTDYIVCPVSHEVASCKRKMMSWLGGSLADQVSINTLYRAYFTTYDLKIYSGNSPYGDRIVPIYLWAVVKNTSGFCKPG